MIINSGFVKNFKTNNQKQKIAFGGYEVKVFNNGKEAADIFDKLKIAGKKKQVGVMIGLIYKLEHMKAGVLDKSDRIILKFSEKGAHVRREGGRQWHDFNCKNERTADRFMKKLEKHFEANI